MKKITLLMIMLFTGLINAQTFKFNPDGTTDYVIYTVDKASAMTLYTKTINWINETYKNPETVIKAKIENEMIRIEGASLGAFSRTFNSGAKADYDVTYNIEIGFQEGKYRIKYTHNTIKIDGGVVYFKFSDLLANITDRNGNNYNGANEQYTSYVQKEFDSLYLYITKPKEKW